MQTITPYLLYEDVAAAIDWLGRAFGFQERLRFADEDGTVTHAELTLGDGAVYLGHPGPDYRSPKQVGTSSHLVHVYVDDVEAHHARAAEAGAPGLGKRRLTVAMPPGLLKAGAAVGRLLPPFGGAPDAIEMLDHGDNVGDAEPANETFGIHPIGLDEQIRRAVS